jgi:hypothetical protein
MKCPSCGSENIIHLAIDAYICLNLYCKTYLFKIKPASPKSQKGPKTKGEITDAR